MEPLSAHIFDMLSQHGFCISKSCKQFDLGHMNSGMLCEAALLVESFATLIALERLLPSVRSHVTLQITRRSASVVALVTFVWLFSCVLFHHVHFQIASRNAGKLTHCASVRLFSRVGPFVPLQSA